MLFNYYLVLAVLTKKKIKIKINSMIITIINCVGLISGNICVFQSHIIIQYKKINKNGTLSGLHLLIIFIG